MKGNIMPNNDDRIIELKKLIEKKEKEIVPASLASKTTLILDFNGQKYNLNVMTLPELQILFCQLQALQTANEKLSSFYTEPLSIGGFCVADWLDDIISKMNYLMTKNKKKDLDAMKKQLDKLLSDGKKTELLLDEIMEKLK